MMVGKELTGVFDEVLTDQGARTLRKWALERCLGRLVGFGGHSERKIDKRNCHIDNRTLENVLLD